MRLLGYTLAAILVLLLAFGYLLYARFPSEPVLPGTLQQARLNWDGHERSYSWYLPDNVAETPALVFVLHGSMGDGNGARLTYAYEFEQLAEVHGFIPVFPTGFENHWNDCRKQGPYSAKAEGIDDVGFLSAVAAELVGSHAADPNRVFATGLSNGGNMALRLGLEAPDVFSAVAPVATNLPIPANLDCTTSGKAVAFLLMNGSNDTMNPHEGGTVALFGLLGNRGEVESSVDTATYFAELAGHNTAPLARTLQDTNPNDGSITEVLEWKA